MQQITLDKYEKLENPLQALVNVIRVEYVPAFIRLKAHEAKVFAYAEKLGLLANEKDTIKIPMQYANIYIEQYPLSETKLSKIAKAPAKTERAIDSFRRNINEATEKALDSISKLGLSHAEVTKIYFGVINKMASSGNANAIAALSELEEKELINYKKVRSIDTRGLEIESKLNALKSAARKRNEIESLDVYFDKNVAEEKVKHLVINDYLPLYYELKRYEEEAFAIAAEYNLLGRGSIRVTTDFGNLYIGIYNELEYDKYNAEAIKNVLIANGFAKSDFTAIDISYINKKARESKVYAEAVETLKNIGYVEFSKMQRIEVKAQEAKNIRR